MPDSNDETEIKNEGLVPLSLVGGENCPVFYTNVGSVQSTPFDIQIIFGEVTQLAEQVLGVARARIVMSPEYAVLLAKILNMRVEAFKKQHGALRNLASAVDTTAPESG